MDVGASVLADEQSFELVQPGEGALDDPAVAAQPGAVRGVAVCDLGFDAALAELAVAARVVVGAVGGDALGSTSRPDRRCRAPAAPGRRAGSAECCRDGCRR
jgi:hypothetical protein